MFNFIFDPKYDFARWLTPVLILASFFKAIGNFFGGIFIAFKDTKLGGLTTVLSAAVNIVAILAFIKIIGIHAATLSTLIAYIVMCIVRYKYLLKKGIHFTFDKEVVLYLIILMYFFTTSYFNFNIINYINLLLATLIFIIANKNIIIAILIKAKEILIDKKGERVK